MTIPAGKSITLSIRPDEIVPANRTITITTAEPLELAAMEGGIAVRGVAGAIEATDRSLTFTPAGPMPIGRQTLVVDELLWAAGRLSPGGSIDFTVVDTPADPGPDVAIESIVRLQLTDEGARRLPLDVRPEKFVDVIKGEDRESRRPIELAVDSDGQAVDLDEHFALIDRRQSEKLGRIHPELDRAFAGGQARVRVAIWLRQPGEAEDRVVHDRLRHQLDEQAERRVRQGVPGVAERDTPREVTRMRESIAAVRRRGVTLVREVADATARPDRLAPVVYATLARDQVDRLAEAEDVVGLFLYDPRGVDDLDASIAIANSSAVHSAGTGGQGVRVAVFESGPDVTSDLDIEDAFDSTPATTSHSRHVHGIIKNVEANLPNGHAPDCRLYSANDTDLDALAWAVEDVDCTIVNQSFHRVAEASSSALSYDDVYKDWLTLSFPYPLLVQASGNTGETPPINPSTNEFVNHKTYNHLTVGSHNDDASAMSSSTVFRNPTTSHGDRELPEIAANGISVTAVGLTLSGTSMASPAVAGCAALVQSTHGSLEVWPEGTRAVLLAGATRNVKDGTWWDDIVANQDTFDGSGSVNAFESHLIAQSRRTRNASGVQRGWDAGTLSSGDLDGFGLSTFRYRVTVPSATVPLDLFGPTHVKVALAWDSEVVEFPIPVVLPIASVLDIDLDLKVLDANGNQVGYSGSWDNSYEIAEFIGTRGETYDIHIRRFSGTRDVWYGVAWTVTGLQRELMPVDPLLGQRSATT